jgi:hypothetical protein
VPLAGHQHQPRDIAALCWDHGWRDLELVHAVAVCLAESQGYDRAFHDNTGDGGQVTSRDVGMFQINIPAVLIGTAAEEALYDPQANVERARLLFDARGWQPWVAWNSGIAMDTAWYRADGKPTGRYPHRAVRGVANFYAVRAGLTPTPFTDYYKVPKPSQ